MFVKARERTRRPDLSDLSGRRVFVTGAASGMGAAVARDLASQGARLFLTDINEAGLKSVVSEIASAEGPGEVCVAEPVDVSDYEAVCALADDIHSGYGPMDVVMNVAGLASWGTVERLEHRQWRSMVDVNLMGPIHVIEEFLPPMIAAGRGGHLVNVSSAAGLIGLPWHAAYSASKFGLRGVSEVLRFDLRQHGIGVSLVCPGGVSTPMAETVEIAGVNPENTQVKKLQHRFRRRAVSPETAAALILEGVKKNRYLVYTSPDIRLAFWSQRFFPPGYVIAMRALNRAADKWLPIEYE